MNKKKILSLYQKAVVNKQQGNNDIARDLFKKVLSKQPSLWEAWFELGDLNLRQELYGDAEECFLKVVKMNPGFAMGYAYLGLSYYYMNILDKAIKSYKKVLDIQPDNLSAICNIGLSLLNMGYRDEAIGYCHKAIAIDKEFAGAHLLLANVLSALGRYEEAYASYSVAKEIQPGDMNVVGGMANSLIKLGEYQKAYDLVSPYIDAASDNVDINVAYASVSKKMGCAEIAQERLEFLLEKKHLMNEQYIQLYFSIGELCDKTGQYDKAFKYYKQGNNRVSRYYSADDDRREVDKIIAAFSENKIQASNITKASSRKHVFIVGMPRSGTSLVEQILSRHSSVFSAGELNKIPELSSHISQFIDSDKLYPDCVESMSEKERNKLSDEYMECFSEAEENVTILTDKLPHNFMYLGFIEKLFPDALIIHCKRNPLDTCLSNYFQYFSGPMGYPYKLENIGAHYLQYQRLMQHWESVLSLPVLEVNYEDLVSDQEAVSKSMIEFCGLLWEPECLSFYESDRIARTASYAQVRKNIYSSSVDKWKNYEKQLEPLIAIFNNQLKG